MPRRARPRGGARARAGLALWLALAAGACGGREPSDPGEADLDDGGSGADADRRVEADLDDEAEVEPPPCPPLEDPAVAGEASALSIGSDFENGNGALVAADQDAGVLVIEPVALAGSMNVWWHVRLDGIVPGRTVTLVTQNDRELGETSPVYSSDRVSWQRFPEEASPFSAVFSTPTVWVARNHPYSWSRSLGLACELERASDRVRSFELATSEGGRAVVALRLTDPLVADEGKSMVWVQARQHASESHGSWVGEGLARWLAGSSEPEAAELLARAVVYLVPIMDVDSAALGGAGNRQQPIDFNHSWNTAEPWNAVAAAIARIDAEHPRTPLRAFVDLHSPWYSSSSYIYYPDRLSEPELDYLRAFSDRMALANLAIGGANAWQTDLHPFDTASRPDLTAGANWYAEARWLAEEPVGLTVPMEVTHGKDPAGAFVTIEGLLDYGEALGHALGWHLGSD